MDKINLKYDDSLPPELHDMATRSLHTAITFLDDQPRPTGIPAIEYFTPQWSQMQFIVGADTLPHGLFSSESMSGWCVLTVRTNGDMVLLTDPLTTVLNVDLELATTVAMVSILDGYFYQDVHFDRQLHRQLSYLDSVATAAPVPPPKIHPTPVMSEDDQRAMDTIANQSAYMKSFCTTEDFDM